MLTHNYNLLKNKNASKLLRGRKTKLSNPK